MNLGLKSNTGTTFGDMSKLDKIERELEGLSIQILTILEDHKRKGLIGKEDYKKHTKYKVDFLAYLDNKRQM